MEIKYLFNISSCSTDRDRLRIPQYIRPTSHSQRRSAGLSTPRPPRFKNDKRRHATFLSMAKPEWLILRQSSPSSPLLSPKGSLYMDGEDTLSDRRCQTHVMRETCELRTEQIHLGRLRRFDVECGCSNRGRCRGFGWFRVPVEKLSQFFEVFLERFEHAALVQGCSWVQ